MKNRYLLITAFPVPRFKGRIRRCRSGTLWVSSTYPPSRLVSRSLDRKPQKPAAPSLTEEIHASSEVTFCFWSRPLSFLRCFPPDTSRILSCDRTIPWMYVRTRRNPQKRRSGASRIAGSGVSSEDRPSLLVDSPPSACHCFFIHVVVRVRASIDLPRQYVLSRPAEAERARVLCVPSGGRETLRTQPTNTCATSARTRSAVAECHRFFGRSRSVRKSIRT